MDGAQGGLWRGRLSAAWYGLAECFPGYGEGTGDRTETIGELLKRIVGSIVEIIDPGANLLADI